MLNQLVYRATLQKYDAVMPCYSVYSQKLAIDNVITFPHANVSFLDVLLPMRNMAPVSDRKV